MQLQVSKCVFWFVCVCVIALGLNHCQNTCIFELPSGISLCCVLQTVVSVPRLQLFYYHTMLLQQVCLLERERERINKRGSVKGLTDKVCHEFVYKVS